MKKNYLKKGLPLAFIILAAACLFQSCKKPANVPRGPVVIVSTLAGGSVGVAGTVNSPVYGEIGSANGIGSAASFYAPAGIVIDAAGNLYISEAGNHDIRKITPDGTVTTFAGNVAGGFVNGTGTAASFSAMQGIAIDAAGNLYAGDSGNQVIRKVSPAGVVTTFAGSGAMGANNGAAASATFNGPGGIAVDAAGNVYVADFGNKMIRKIGTDGMVSTLAGSGLAGYNNGAGATATFTSPERLAVDAAGNVYVTDFKMVRKITPGGTVSTLAGNDNDPNIAYSASVDGKGSAASFTVADGITIDASGTIFMGDLGLFRKITPDGTVTTLAGGGTSGPPGANDGEGAKASFGFMRGIAVNAAGNLIYTADYATSLIRKIVIE